MNCPRCHRETYYVPQVKRMSVTGIDPAPKPGMLLAAKVDGTCSTCQRIIKGSRTAGNGRPLKRGTMTDEECEAIREKLRIMELDRRARGIGEDGIPVWKWAAGNGGLYSWQIK